MNNSTHTRRSFLSRVATAIISGLGLSALRQRPASWHLYEIEYHELDQPVVYTARNAAEAVDAARRDAWLETTNGKPLSVRQVPDDQVYRFRDEDGQPQEELAGVLAGEGWPHEVPACVFCDAHYT